MADHQSHGRVRLRPGDGLNGEDTIGVTIWGNEFSMPAAEWEGIAFRISTAAPVATDVTDQRVAFLLRGANDALRERDAALLRATTAEAALAASQERERKLTEALSKALDAADEVARAKGRLASVRGASDQKRRNMEEWVQRSTAALDAALSFARAALKQEAANVR